MASPITTEAGHVSKKDNLFYLVENAPIIDEFFPVLPLRPVDGYLLQIPRVQSAHVPTSDFVTEGDSVNDNCATADAPTEFSIYRVVGDVRISGHVKEIYSNSKVDQVKVQLDMKILGTKHVIGENIITGNGTDGKLNGLDALVDSGMKVGADNGAANGGPLGLGDIDSLIAKIKSPQGRPDILLCNADVQRQYANLCYTNGFAPQLVQTPWFAHPVMAHRGIPILTSDFILKNYTKGTSSDTSRLWAITLGVEGVFGIYCASDRGGIFKVMELPERAYDVTKYRVSCNLGLAVMRTTSFGCVEGITY
jgi:hypothetical protein